MKKLTLISLLFCLSSLFAQDTKETFQGSWLFGGFQFGPSFLDTGVANELNKVGMHADVKGLVSYYWPKWVADGGVGWGTNWMTGDSNNTPLVEDTVTTRAAVVEVNGRYRFKPRWEFGIQNKLLVGTDTRFSTVGADDQYASIFSGPEIVYARRDLAWPTRFKFAVLTDWNVPDRQVWMALMGVEFGLQLSRKPREKVVQGTVPEVVPPPQEKEYVPPVVVVTFDLDAIHFKFDKSDVTPQTKRIITALSQFLASEPNAWRMLRIEGHADNRGAEEYNQALSERRATSVQNLMIQNGVSAPRIETIGYGESQPKVPEDNEVAWAKNRRVEFVFDGVSDPAKFKQAIDDIREKYGKPELFPWTRK